MSVHLTQKERSILQDQLKHEEVCIEKYTNYAQQAQDSQLSSMFNQFAQQEQEHYNSIQQLLRGEETNLSSHSNNIQYGIGNQYQPTGLVNENDNKLCRDMLMTEAFVSNSYDNAIFQSTNSSVKQALQHIQKEEQQHGEGLQGYLQQFQS